MFYLSLHSPSPTHNDRRASRRLALSTTLLLSFLLLAPLPSSAETLVLSDGSEIETDGPWRIDGRRVLFTNSSGALGAVRLSNVDLEESEKRNQPRAETKAIETAASKTVEQEPVLVLKDGDLARSRSFSSDISRFLDSRSDLRDEIWALHTMYQLDTEEGVQKAASSIELIANRWHKTAHDSKGKNRQKLLEMARSAQTLARLAKADPGTFARRWQSALSLESNRESAR